MMGYRRFPLISVLGEEHAQRIVRALDVRNYPAIGTVDENEIQRDRTAFVVEGDLDIGLVELPANDGDRDRADLPRRALHQKIVRLALQRDPCLAQCRVEKLARGGEIAR